MIDIFDLDDVTFEAWAEIVEAAPPADLPVYYLDTGHRARRFVRVVGPRISRCRVYDYRDPRGNRILAVEPLGEEVEIAEHISAILPAIVEEAA